MEGLVIILDLEKYGLRHLWKPALDIYTHVLAIFEANYPETLHRTYVVNAPKIFPIAYNLTKPFLSADTKEKVHVLGKNWKHRLLEVIDADQLPVHWGGTATDPDGDPYCRSQVCMGGEIPSHHYTNHLENVDISQFTTKSLGRGSSLELEYPVQRQNTVLRWQFFTEDSDLSFSIARQSSTSAGEGEPQSSSKAEAVEEIVKPCRVNSHLIPESGSLVCTIPATYIIKFDNSYSWLKSKKLSYLIEVLPPADIAELHTSPSFAIPRGDSSAQLSMD
ncbi:SEC14-like protein 2 [Lamellibrachia satsuma]|nr:SEC14-like protein 2 [Lamellibrachia satsuma]